MSLLLVGIFCFHLSGFTFVFIADNYEEELKITYTNGRKENKNCLNTGKKEIKGGTYISNFSSSPGNFIKGKILKQPFC